LYDVGAGQEQKRIYSYIEVPVGQGKYYWIDYNHDEVQQANEFELAVYPEQKKFIRILVPTNEYVRVNYMQVNQTLSFDPMNYFIHKKINTSWSKFASKFSNQFALQVQNRVLADEGLDAYWPVTTHLEDSSIINTNTIINNSFFFNRASSKWGIDY